MSTTSADPAIHPKCAIGLVGDFEVRLAGGEHDEPFRLAVPDGDRTVGIEVQYGIIRQATSQLLAVPCLKVQCRDAIGRRGALRWASIPRQEQAKTQHSARRHRHCGGEPAG